MTARTITEELLEQVEDGRSVPLHERVQNLGARGVYDPRDNRGWPDGVAYSDDVCIVDPLLIQRAVDRIWELETEVDGAAGATSAKIARFCRIAQESESRVVAERRRGDEWEQLFRTSAAEREKLEARALAAEKDRDEMQASHAGWEARALKAEQEFTHGHYMAEIDKLRNERDEARKRLKATTVDRDLHKERAEKAEDERDRSRGESNELRGQICNHNPDYVAKTKAKITTLELDLERALDRVKDYQHACIQKQEGLDSLQQELDSLRRNRDSLRRTVGRDTQVLAQIRQERNECKLRADKAETELEEVRGLLASDQNRLANAEKRIKELGQRNSKLAGTLRRLIEAEENRSESLVDAMELTGE